MAEKTIYQPKKDEIGVNKILIEYTYYSGFAVSQKQKCIKSLHEAAQQNGISNILEVSSKSLDEIGTKLSSFNLNYKLNNNTYTVEQLFQSGKVFEKGGPYIDLLEKTSKEAKTDPRLKSSGNLIGFNLLGTDFPLEPKTFYYDWLYINALLQNKELISKVINFSAFSDIEFNEKKSINCQAYSLALFCSLLKNKPDILNKNSINKDEFLALFSNEYKISNKNLENICNSEKQQNKPTFEKNIYQKSLDDISETINNLLKNYNRSDLKQ